MEASFSVLWSGFVNANSHTSGEVRNSEAKYQNLLQGSITEILLLVEIIPLKLPVRNTVWTKCLRIFPLPHQRIIIIKKKEPPPPHIQQKNPKDFTCQSSSNTCEPSHHWPTAFELYFELMRDKGLCMCKVPCVWQAQIFVFPQILPFPWLLPFVISVLLIQH